MEKSVLLWRYRDSGGFRSLYAVLAENGDVRLEGQDLGPGVEQIFGEGLTEYEYTMTILAQDVPALRRALGDKSDLLQALKEALGDPGMIGPKAFLDEHNIPHEFWSRIGD
jgi:hypothetical protein